MKVRALFFRVQEALLASFLVLGLLGCDSAAKVVLIVLFVSLFLDPR